AACLAAAAGRRVGVGRGGAPARPRRGGGWRGQRRLAGLRHLPGPPPPAALRLGPGRLGPGPGRGAGRPRAPVVAGPAPGGPAAGGDRAGLLGAVRGGAAAVGHRPAGAPAVLLVPVPGQLPAVVRGTVARRAPEQGGGGP